MYFSYRDQERGIFVLGGEALFFLFFFFFLEDAGGPREVQPLSDAEEEKRPALELKSATEIKGV